MNFNILKLTSLISKSNRKRFIQNQGCCSVFYNHLHYQACNEPILDFKHDSPERKSLVTKLEQIASINTQDALFDVPIVITVNLF